MELGSLNLELNTKQIQMSAHAYERAAQRLHYKDKNVALGNIRTMLRKATKIGEVEDEEGNPAIMYGHDKVAIYLTPDLKIVKTVIVRDNVTYDPIKEKVRELHAKEIRKLSRTIGARKKRLNFIKAEADLEIAELKLRILKSRSQPVKEAAKARIQAINEYIKQLEDEINSMNDSKRQIAKSMVAVL